MAQEDGSPAFSDGDLRRALAAEQFETVFQPIVRVADGVPVGFEALARLRHPHRGTIKPDHFVPQMEGAGLALTLADQITARALTALPPGFLELHAMSVAVNLPLDVLLGPDALDRLDAVRRASGVPARCLTIELTESQPVTDVDALAAAIGRWRAAGYELAIDDVSQDMPKHRALLLLPFSKMKLDRGAVTSCRDTATGRGFVQETIDAAHERGLSVVAEGIEDAQTWDLMAELGADEVQGFLVAEPLTAEEVPDWLRHWQEDER